MPKCLQQFLPSTEDPQPNSHCIYSKEFLKPEEKSSKTQSSAVKNIQNVRTSPNFYNQISTVYFVLYLSIQITLPYSHGITKGYNNWTNGLYGYSWDMMVHSWSVQHIRISALQKDTGEVLYLNPKAWTTTRRWSSHADMVKQYAHCIEKRLAAENLTNIALYFDIYRSLNNRFQQRMFDPTVDILTADWHPFYPTPWLKPLLVDLSDWRTKLDEIEKEIYKESNDSNVVFIADFPGLNMDQFVPKDLGNTTVTVLNGDIIVEMNDQSKNVTLKQGEKFQVPAGEFHTTHTVSDTPSCYMYIYINTTEVELVEKIAKYKSTGTQTDNDTDGKTNDNSVPFSDIPQLDDNDIDKLHSDDPQVARLYNDIQEKRDQIMANINVTVWDRFMQFAEGKYFIFQRSFEMSGIALKSIMSGRPFDDVLKESGIPGREVIGQT